MSIAPVSSNRLDRPKRLLMLWIMFFFQFAAIGVYFTFLNVYYLGAGLSGAQIGVINMATALVGVGGVVMWGYLSDRFGKPRLFIAIGAVGSLVGAQIIPLVHTFEAFLVIASVSAILGSATSTLVDSTALALLGDRREEYGRYRLGGSIGYIITTLAAGYLYDRVSLGMLFPTYGVIMALFAVTALLLPPVAIRRTERAQGGGLRVMMQRPAWILFTVCVFLCWIAMNSSILFLGVSLKAMGASQSLIAISVTIGAIIEAPFMMFSGRLMRRFGPVKLLLTAMALMVLRYLLLGLMPAPIWSVPINILNGPAFVLFWTSAIVYANKMAPPNLQGTVQGLLNSTTSLGGVVSSLLTGWLFDLLGPSRLFLVMSGFCVIGLTLFFAGTLGRRAVAQQSEA